MSNNGFMRSTAAYCALLGVVGLALSASCTLTVPVVRRSWAAVRDPHHAPDRLVGDCVELLSAVLLSAALLWLVVSAAVCVCDVSRQLGPHRRRRSTTPPRPGLFRPRFLRALVALALSSAVVSPATGAHADRRPELPRRLDGLPLPDRAYGVVRTHEVRTGESLWSISAELVRDRTPRRAGPAVIARTWPRLCRLNRHRIGPDPGLIRPGTTLRLPARTAVPRTPAHPVTHPGATR